MGFNSGVHHGVTSRRHTNHRHRRCCTHSAANPANSNAAELSSLLTSSMIDSTTQTANTRQPTEPVWTTSALDVGQLTVATVQVRHSVKTPAHHSSPTNSRVSPSVPLQGPFSIQARAERRPPPSSSLRAHLVLFLATRQHVCTPKQAL